MKAEILGYLLGNLTVGYLIAFYIFAFIGMIYSMVTHYKQKAAKTKVKFDFKHWILDNLARLTTSIISIFIVARFANYLEIPMAGDIILGLATGLYLDKLIILIRNKTDIGIFQKK